MKKLLIWDIENISIKRLNQIKKIFSIFNYEKIVVSKEIIQEKNKILLEEENFVIIQSEDIADLKIIEIIKNNIKEIKELIIISSDSDFVSIIKKCLLNKIKVNWLVESNNKKRILMNIIIDNPNININVIQENEKQKNKKLQLKTGKTTKQKNKNKEEIKDKYVKSEAIKKFENSNYYKRYILKQKEISKKIEIKKQKEIFRQKEKERKTTCECCKSKEKILRRNVGKNKSPYFEFICKSCFENYIKEIHNHKKRTGPKYLKWSKKKKKERISSNTNKKYIFNKNIGLKKKIKEEKQKLEDRKQQGNCEICKVSGDVYNIDNINIKENNNFCFKCYKLFIYESRELKKRKTNTIISHEERIEIFKKEKKQELLKVGKINYKNSLLIDLNENKTLISNNLIKIIKKKKTEEEIKREEKEKENNYNEVMLKLKNNTSFKLN